MEVAVFGKYQNQSEKEKSIPHTVS